MTAIGVIGLGAMGSRVADRLEATAVWNRTPRAGMLDTPAEVARASDVVFVLVRDPDALIDVSEGPDGLASAGRPVTVVQMSTVTPAAVLRLADVLEGDVLDAPVLGSVGEVEAGTLTVFAGGDAALIERLRPMLSRLGRIVETGGLGSATGAKLVANATLFGVLGALGEALVLADRLGLDRETAWRVLATTPLAAQAERRRPAVESGEFPSRFGVGVARKDAELIKAVGGDLRVLEAARSWLADAEATDPDRDYSAVLAEILRQG